MAPKNLLVIMADEHNPKMLGCAEHPLVKTPSPRCIGEARDTFQSGVYELSDLRACARQVSRPGDMFTTSAIGTMPSPMTAE